MSFVIETSVWRHACGQEVVGVQAFCRRCHDAGGRLEQNPRWSRWKPWVRRYVYPEVCPYEGCHCPADGTRGTFEYLGPFTGWKGGMIA
jgi:hypothetical protein